MTNKIAFKSFKEFQKEVLENQELQDQLKNDPKGTLQKMAQQIPDTKVYRIVVSVLGSSIVLIILGVIIAWISGKITTIDSVPTILVTSCAAAIGALTAILVPSPNETN